MIGLREITPELLIKLEEERNARILAETNRLAVEKVRQELESAKRAVLKLELYCKDLAKALRRNGLPVVEIAEWLGVSVATIYSWLRLPIIVVPTKKAWGTL